MLNRCPHHLSRYLLIFLIFPIQIDPLRAQGHPRPAPGIFLVADESIMDPRFQKSVLLITQHDDRGTMGIMVNHPTRTRISESLPQLEIPEEKDDALYIGGPVTRQISVLIQHWNNQDIDNAERVFRRVFFSTHGEAIRWAVQHDMPRVRLYSGYAGWAPGQLEHELRRGDWHMVPADEATLFDKDAADIWRELSKDSRHQQWVRRVSDTPDSVRL